MCGISGVIPLNDKITKEQIYKIQCHLLKENMWRGRIATGIATFDISEEKIYIYKSHADADEFIEKGLKPEHIHGPTLAHNRAPTRGPPEDKNNNHPVFQKSWCLIHNGQISNKNIEDYPYKGTCDSEVLLSLIEQYGLEEGIKQIDGSASFAAFNKDTFDFVLYKHNNPLNLLYIPNVLFAFSSLEKPLKDIPKMLNIPKLWGIFDMCNFGEFDEGRLFKYNLLSKNIEFKNIEIENVLDTKK